MLSRVSSCLIRRIASPGGAAFGLLHFSWMLPYPCVSAHIAVLCPPMRLLDVHSYINRDARTVQSITSRRSCLSPSFRPITTSPSTQSIHSSFVHRLRPSILDSRTPHTYSLHPHIFLNKGYSTQKPSSFRIFISFLPSCTLPHPQEDILQAVEPHQAEAAMPPCRIGYKPAFLYVHHSWYCWSRWGRNLTNSTSILATAGAGRTTSSRHLARDHPAAPGDVEPLERATSERAASQRRLRPGRDDVQRDRHSLRVHRDRPEVRSSFCATAPCAIEIESRPVCPETCCG